MFFKKSFCLSLTLVATLLASTTACNNAHKAVTPEAPENNRTAIRLATESHSIETDKAALIALYDALEGEKWIDNRNWKSNAPLAEWYGVQVAQVHGQDRVVALRLGHNNLQGSIPEEIGNLSALQVLDLGYNTELNGSIPEELYNLIRLEVLKIRNTSVTGSLSSSIQNLVKIDTLDLKTAPYALNDDFTSLETLYAKNEVRMTGVIPAEIGKLRNARYIDLCNQGFSGSIPQEIGNLRAVTFLDLSNNNLSGNVPASIGNLKNLRTLFIGHNQLTGSIPTEIGNASNLDELFLNNNQLSGKIPAELSKLNRLTQLSLEYNKLSGEIPATLTSMRALMTLRLGYNQLSGTIPVGFGAGVQKGHLIRVSLKNNNLTGNVPARINQAPQGQEGYAIFELSGNRLSGVVPQEYIKYPETLHYLIPQQNGYGFSNLN